MECSVEKQPMIILLRLLVVGFSILGAFSCEEVAGSSESFLVDELRTEK